MAWTTPRCWTTGEVVTAAIMNAHVRDNLNVTSAGVVTAAGDITYASASHTMARLAKGTDGNILHQASCIPAWTASPSLTGLTLSGALDVNGTIDYDGTDVDMLSSGDIDLVSSANAAAAIYIAQSTGTSGTIKIHADTGTSVTEGAESINILSDVGGIGLRSTANLAKAINLTSDGGSTGSIAIFNDQGTSVTEGAESISLLSDAGGIGIRSTADLANAINLTNDGGTSGTITLFNDQGTSVTEGAASIELLSDAGGIELKSTANLAKAINIMSDGGTTGSIMIFNDQGTSVTEGAASIALVSDAGGVELRSTANLANAINITSDGGTTGTISIFNDLGSSVTEGAESISLLSDAGGVGIRSTANLANAVNITADGGTTSTIQIYNDQGTAVNEGVASVQLLSDVGGIGIKSGLNAAGAIRLTADAGTSETIILHADQGNGTGSICLTSDAGGITLNPGTFVTVGANATNAAEVRMFEDTDNGCNYVALKAPNVSTSYTITLPTAVAGTCGFVLTSTTAGVTSWAAAAGGDVVCDTSPQLGGNLDMQARLLVGNGGTTGIAISADGEITMAAQPAFSLENDTTCSNIGTSQHTVAWDTERFDQGCNFNASTETFTAPITGRYLLSVQLQFSGITAAVSNINTILVTSNLNYHNNTESREFTECEYYPTMYTVVADMDACDTALAKVTVTGATTVDIGGGMFTGVLVA